MPYGRRSSSRRPLRRGRKVAYSRRARGKIVKGYTRTGGLYGRFNNIAKKVENKFYRLVIAGSNTALAEVAITGTVPTRVSTLFGINTAGSGAIANDYIGQIPQSATPTGRIGRKVFIRSMEGHFRIRLGPASTVTAPSLLTGAYTIDVWIVQDTQTNGSATGPAATDIWNGTPLALSTQSFSNLANEGRFKILHHKQILVNSAVGVASTPIYSGTVYEFNTACLPKCTMEWDNTDTAGALTSCRSNSFHLFCSAIDNSNLVPVTAYISGEIQLRYTDL